jgi:hypothetical protein
LASDDLPNLIWDVDGVSVPFRNPSVLRGPARGIALLPCLFTEIPSGEIWGGRPAVSLRRRAKSLTTHDKTQAAWK